MNIYRFFSNLADSITLILLFRFASKRLSIQYVYERVFLYSFRLSFVSQSGCKTTTSFLISKNFLKFFWNFFFASFLYLFLPIYQGTFRILRGANVKSIFKSRKLFRIFFFENFFPFDSLSCQYFDERLRCCGCKSSTSIYISKTFFYIISIFFCSFS